MINAALPSLRLFLVAALALLVALAFASPRPTSAGATYLVTKTADTADGTCDADCSLREAVIAANAAPGTVNLPEGTYNLTIPDPQFVEDNESATGDLDLNSAIQINGFGADDTIIDAGGQTRVFHMRAANMAVTISGVTIRNGIGGIYVASGSLTLDESTVSDNTTAQSNNGGGILSQAVLIVNNSTISGNTATGASGGGLYNSQGMMTVTNSTVSGNTALFGGGGVFNSAIATTTLTHVTVANNTSTTANSGGNIRRDGQLGSVTLKNTIVAEAPAGGNCFGTITSNGHNLDSDDSCNLNGSGDISGEDPLLVPLTLNAPGTTETHAIPPNSPAHDAAGLDCRPPDTDQRGVDRFKGQACDIGAYEVDPRGDTNCDGEIDGDDVVPVLSEVEGFPTLVDCLENGDVDLAGGITIVDALLILQYGAGIITVFPNSGD